MKVCVKTSREASKARMVSITVILKLSCDHLDAEVAVITTILAFMFHLVLLF